MDALHTGSNVAKAARRCALAALLTFACAGCDLPGKPNPKNRPVPPSQIVDFEELYSRNCSGCHGADGTLGPAPPLNDPLFLALFDAGELSRVVRLGRRGTPMPGFAHDAGGPLTPEQIDALVAGIQSKWKTNETFPQPLPPLVAGASEGQSPGSAERGGEVFAVACAGCHGANGRGMEEDGEIRHAINDPAFLALISNQALRRIIITGRADLGMPNFAEPDGRPDNFRPLTSAQIADLVAVLASWRGDGQVAATSDER